LTTGDVDILKGQTNIVVVVVEVVEILPERLRSKFWQITTSWKRRKVWN
jgi:hypothetical protein